MTKRHVFALAALLASSTTLAIEPAASPLSAADRACAINTSLALQGPLVKAGLIDRNKVNDNATEVTLLAKQSLPHGASRQVFLMTLHETSPGRTVTIIATSDTRDGECPYSQTSGFVVSKKL